MEGLEGAFDVVFQRNRGHVEAVAAGSRGKSEFFHSVHEVVSGVAARDRLDEKCLVFKCNEASAETAAQDKKAQLYSQSNFCNRRIIECDSLMEYVKTEVALLSARQLSMRLN